MISDKIKLCMGCMSAREDDEDQCPHCGYSENFPHSVNCLPPRTMLTDRYIVGKVLKTNGESILYLGYNLESNQKVWIREFMPTNLCSRNQMDNSLIIHSGKDTQFKTMLSDFYDLARFLTRLASANDGIYPIQEILQKNNTIYVVIQYVKVISLKDFLSRGSGELAWGQVKKLIMPLCNSISNMHNAGLLHRGISLENVCIDQTGKLWLDNFALPELRTAHSCLTPELYPGYTAPEQYSPNAWQGTWTDVYAMAALLYRILTGTMPPDASSRTVNDNLCPAVDLNGLIPQNVSDAIEAALQIDVEARTQTMDEFTAQLLESVQSNTTVYASGKRNAAAKSSSSQTSKKKKKSGRVWPYVLVSLCITMLLLSAGIFYFMWKFMNPSETDPTENSSSQISSESSQVTPGSDKVIPSFLGQLVDEVIEDKANAKYTFTQIHQYNEDFPEGYIFNQSPASGLEAPSGRITLYISDGPELLQMPSVIGVKRENAERMLKQIGITYQVISKLDKSFRPGIIEEASVEEGVWVKKGSQTVYLYVLSEEEWLTSSTEKEESSEAASSENS